jgi:hypothetical protein
VVNSHRGGKLLTIKLLAGSLAVAFKNGLSALWWLYTVKPGA